MQNNKLSPGNLVILVAGVVMVLASFFAFYKISAAGFSKSYNAWDSGINLFGIATLPALLGAIMAVHVALTTFANVNLPDRIFSFTWDQIHIALGFQAAIMMVMFLFRDKSILDFGIGFYLMLLAAIALLVGAVMRQREGAPAF